MLTSDQIQDLVTALAKAQASYKPIEKDKRVAAGPIRYSYADYATVLEAIRPALNANGLAIIQGVESNGPKVTVTTRLAHTSGQWVESVLEVTAETGAVQKLGSAMTYARRYSFLAIVGAAPTDEDDDGAAAMPSPRPPAQRQQRGVEAVRDAEPVEDEPSPFNPGAAANAGEKMREVIERMKQTADAATRKAAVLTYLEGRYGPSGVRPTVARVIGRTIPDGREILVNLKELELLEAFVHHEEAADTERRGGRDD